MNVKVCSVVFAVLVAGCQGPNVQEVEKQEAAPVNCATAEGDLRTLQSEKVEHR